MSTEATAQDWAAERRLVLRAQDGDSDAFGELVDRCQGRLFRSSLMILGNRQDAEDVVQESLILAWRRLHLLEDPAAFRGWIVRICTRRATDMVRLQARRATDAQDHDDLEAATASTGSVDGRSRLLGSGPGADPARTAEVHAEMDALMGALSTLDPGLRACWVLREMEDMSYQDISRALDLPAATVRGRLSRARTQIMTTMEGWR